MFGKCCGRYLNLFSICIIPNTDVSSSSSLLTTWVQTNMHFIIQSHGHLKSTFKENKNQGSVSIKRPSFPGMGMPMLRIRRSDRLIFNMGIPILVRRHLYIETAPRAPSQYKTGLSRHRDSHFKNKLSYLYSDNSYTRKMVSLNWDGPLVWCWGPGDIRGGNIFNNSMTYF